MSYLTRSELQQIPYRFTESQRRNIVQRFHTKYSDAQITVFLSHSHKDAELIESFLLLLENEDVIVYVDWKDKTMPAMTSSITARQLKARIRICGKFMVLGTNNALLSRWVPWELGIADLQNGMPNVAIVPVVDIAKQWMGNEYVGIYSRVERADSGRMAVFEPGKDRGILLSDWLRRK